MSSYIGFVFLIVIGLICYSTGMLLRYFIDRNNVSGIVELIRLMDKRKK